MLCRVQNLVKHVMLSAHLSKDAMPRSLGTHLAAAGALDFAEWRLNGARQTYVSRDKHRLHLGHQVALLCRLL